MTPDTPLQITTRRHLNEATTCIEDTQYPVGSNNRLIAFHQSKRQYPDEPFSAPAGWIDTGRLRITHSDVRTLAETLLEYATEVEGLDQREHREHEWTAAPLPKGATLEPFDLIAYADNGHVETVERLTATQAITNRGTRLRRQYGTSSWSGRISDSIPGRALRQFRAYRPTPPQSPTAPAHE